MRLAYKAILVWSATAAPVAIPDVLSLAAARFDFDLVALVLVDRLFDRHLKRRASAALVNHRHTEASQVSFEQGGIHSVAGKTARAVDDDLVEATRDGVAGLGDQVKEFDPLVVAPALHVEPLGRYLAAKLVNLPLACMELRWSCKRHILSVVGAESSVEGEASHPVTRLSFALLADNRSLRNAPSC
jgi:hypothetical protein